MKMERDALNIAAAEPQAWDPEASWKDRSVAFIAASCPRNWPFGGGLPVFYVCLVGSSEDELRLRLRLSLVPGQTRPCA
jgi:hypothetical protein